MSAGEEGPARSASIRERNELLVLKLIFRNGVLSQSEASARTGLKPPTVFRIFAELERRGLIAADAAHRIASAERKGRRPLYYRAVPEAAYAVGVDFWAGSAAALVQDFTAGIVASRVVAFPVPPDAEAALAVVRSLVEEVLAEAGIPADRVLGIGVGAPGSVDPESGRVLFYARISGMGGFPLGARLAESFGVPVHVHNNASVVAMAEQRYGSARGVSSLFSFLLRSGVGGAFIQDGRPLTGRGRTAFEVGHLSVDMEGPPCSCGSRGCLENYISEEAILRAASTVSACPDMDCLEERLAAGDESVRRSLEPVAAIVAAAARSLRRLLAPEALLFVTRSRALSELLARAAASEEPGDGRFGGPDPRGLAAAYDPVLACRAACDLAWDSYFAGSSGPSKEGE